MSAPDRPHITVFCIMSADGRLLPPTDEDLVRQEAEVESFDAVILDGCDVGRAVPSLSVWIGPGSASPAVLERAGAVTGPVVVFSTRAVQDSQPAHLKILRERSDLARRLYRLRRELRTRRLLCPLGCNVSVELIAQDLVDELRIIMRPEIMGGRKSPTLTGLDRPAMLKSTRWSLQQLVRLDDACGLVYRRA